MSIDTPKIDAVIAAANILGIPVIDMPLQDYEFDSLPGLIAASAILRTEAQVLYPKDNRKDEERRSKYIEDRLHEMHKEVLASLQTWQDRQRWHLCNRRWRIYDNDPFLEITLKNILIPRINLWEEHLETDKTA